MNIDPDIDPYGVVQLIPYTGPDFDPAWQNLWAPIAWALCNDGKVRVVVVDLSGGKTWVSDREDWWDVT